MKKAKEQEFETSVHLELEPSASVQEIETLLEENLNRVPAEKRAVYIKFLEAEIRKIFAQDEFELSTETIQ